MTNQQIYAARKQDQFVSPVEIGMKTDKYNKEVKMVEYRNEPKTENDKRLAEIYLEYDRDIEKTVQDEWVQKNFEGNRKRVQGKLQYFGIYKKKEEVKKEKKKAIPTKKEMVSKIEEVVGCELETLDKANKPDLMKLVEYVCGITYETE